MPYLAEIRYLVAMPVPASQPIEIVPVAPEGRLRALELLLADWEAEDRRRQLAEFAKIPADSPSWKTLLAADRGGRMIGAAWGQIQPGRVAGIWLPQIVPGAPATVGLSLLQAVCQQLPAQNVQLAQSLLCEEQTAEGRLLRQSGFLRIATLEYLFSMEGDFPTVRPSSALEFVPYSPATHDRLAAVVEATYKQTLDCPQLNGLRTIDDVLAGYRAAGQFDPGLWLLVQHERQDVGCLLLTNYPDYSQWELGYMGIRPEIRGRGWGLEVVRYAQWRCRQAGCPRMVLAVDTSNGPARRMYQAAGFRIWQRRVAYLNILSARG